MNVKVLYVHQPTQFKVAAGAIEPIVLQSGQAGSPLVAPEHALLEPGVYRMPADVRFEAQGTSPDHFVVTDTAGKDDPHAPIQPSLMRFPHLAPDEVRRRIRVATLGDGETATLVRKPHQP